MRRDHVLYLSRDVYKRRVGVDAMIKAVMVIGAVIVTLCFSAVLANIQVNTPSAIPHINADPHLNDIGGMQNIVKIHIHPPQENVCVNIFSDHTYTFQEVTDGNGDVVFEMIPDRMYTVSVPERNISVKLYPTENKYVLYGSDFNVR